MSFFPFEFSPEEIRLRDEVRAFTKQYIEPIAKEYDEKSIFPADNVRKMGEHGWMGIPFPKEYGGLGMSTVGYCLAVIELSKVCASHGITLGAHTGIGCGPIWLMGTNEQKLKYLAPLARGEKLGSFGLTEPGAGSDAGGTRTFAENKGEAHRPGKRAVA
ncbi:MAG TPA: acyl-CoA dehydrogenase family protein [bacterium]|nr:acyl-CoA dehydrogenase family protein [bacterium]